MEWVETTAKTLDEAKELALDRLGVAADEAEFDVVEEPKPGLFGRLRGEARVRARVRPATVRPKHDRRRRKGKAGARTKGGDSRSKSDQRSTSDEGSPEPAETTGSQPATASDDGDDDARRGDQADRGKDREAQQERGGRSRGRSARSTGKQARQQRDDDQKEQQMDEESSVTPQEVGEAAEAFMSGLAEAFGATVSSELEVDGTEIEVRLTGSELGLLVGPGGRTLVAVQDLARVSSQRRLGDHDTRLRVDVGGYREKRRAALEKFAVAVSDEVRESGRPKALEPMASPDRKTVHDVVVGLDGVTSRSEGDDPRRRVVISPE